MVTADAAPAAPPRLPRSLERARRILAVIGRVELAFAIVALVVVVVLSGAQALLRYAFGTSLWWAQEVSGTLMLFGYFLGASYIFKTRQYILIEFLSQQMPLVVQRVLYLFAQVAAIVFAGALAWLTFQFAPTLLGMRSPVLGLSGILTGIPVGLAAAMITLTSLYYLAFGLWVFGQSGAGDTLAEIEEIGLVIAPLGELE